MEFISFTSGSCGNCYWIGREGSGLLIDAGASMRAVRKAMLERGKSLDDIGAVLVTHDHLDHIRFLGTFCKYRRPRVCASKRLHGALARHTYTRDHIGACRQVLEEDRWNDVGDFKILWFEVPHDATQTLGYAIKCPDGHLLVLMTDLEHVTPKAMELAKEADTVVIESNYDYNMLINGPYSQDLKQRILDEGHLSNASCAAAIKEFFHSGLKNIFLCHLSGNNNTPQLAYDSASSALEEIGIVKGTVNLRVLPRGVVTPVIKL